MHCSGMLLLEVLQGMVVFMWASLPGRLLVRKPPVPLSHQQRSLISCNNH